MPRRARSILPFSCRCGSIPTCSPSRGRCRSPPISRRKPLGRLAGVEVASVADEEKTFGELETRVATTLDFIHGLKRGDIDAGAERDITFPVGPKQVTMQGRNYLFHFAMPNFFFHYATAYGILRHCGVEVGKFDFMGKIPGFPPM